MALPVLLDLGDWESASRGSLVLAVLILYPNHGVGELLLGVFPPDHF